MYGFEGPIDIPVLGPIVAQAVEAFAQERDLSYTLWHQNAPIWLVWQDVKADHYIREVQVAAFRTNSGEALFFIPHAFQFIEEKLLATPPTSGVQRSLQTFYANLDVETIRQEIRTLLDRAWSDAETFKKSDLSLQV